MAVTNFFRENVKKGNLLGIHIMMKDSMMRDATFEEFGEMERIARGMKDLYVPHDGRTFEPNKAKWDDEYLAEIQAQLLTNFSHERVDHLKEVIQYLHPIDSPERQYYASLNKAKIPTKAIHSTTSTIGTVIGATIGIGTAVHSGAPLLGVLGAGLGGAALGLVGGAALGFSIAGVVSIMENSEANNTGIEKSKESRHNNDFISNNMDQRGGM